MEETVQITISIIIGILLFFSIGMVAYSYNNTIKIENFENTIKDLTDEEKCLHICGFTWKGYFENYKFCVEKCDRISERDNKCAS